MEREEFQRNGEIHTRTIGCRYVAFVKIFRWEINWFERNVSEGDEGGPEDFRAAMEKIKK